MCIIPAAFRWGSLWHMLAQSKKQHVRRRSTCPNAHMVQAAATPTRTSQKLAAMSRPIRGNSWQKVWNATSPRDTTVAEMNAGTPNWSTTNVRYFLKPGVLQTCDTKKSNSSTLREAPHNFVCSETVKVPARVRITRPNPARSLDTGTPRRNSSEHPSLAGSAPRSARADAVDDVSGERATQGLLSFLAHMADAARRTPGARLLAQRPVSSEA
mmetsp:Transcript_74182/g.226964  ORF Transcript_74182/g.226964 Transcript_74182/m.226964 type:complete len:213 (+) Transcript_74182:683-1321(+)